MSSIYNYDGTLYDPPKTPEYEAYIKSIKEEICNKGGFGYRCMYCNKCIYGDNFEASPELQKVLDAQYRVASEYVNQHNPNGLSDLLIEFNIAE